MSPSIRIGKEAKFSNEEHVGTIVITGHLAAPPKSMKTVLLMNSS